MSIVFLNGEFLNKNEASVSVLDRGFIFADGVYEVMPVYNSRLFRFQEHMQRLQISLDLIHITNPHSIIEWQEILKNIISKNPGKNQSIYLQVTRGVAERDHVFDENMTPTVFVMSRELIDNPAKQGIAAITHEDTRWKYCNIKSIALLPGVLLRYEAHQQQAKEAILHRDGYITEGAASNVFVINDGVIYTPPKDNKILPGITRDLVVEIAREHNLSLEEDNIPMNGLAAADEIWVTSSTQEILPVTKLDGEKVGTGEPGPVWKKMNQLYQEFKNNFSG